jgi:hypothetical protein
MYALKDNPSRRLYNVANEDLEKLEQNPPQDNGKDAPQIKSEMVADLTSRLQSV